MPTAGYSGTPLPKKLGITVGCDLALVDPPDGFDETLGIDPPDPDFPADVTLHEDLASHRDVVVAFVTERRRFEEIIADAEQAIFPAGGLWIAWPKRASKVATDMTEDVVREVALPRGLVDNKVCAIDQTWSGLRVVWRKELRRP
jgi:hypothetical protein